MSDEGVDGVMIVIGDAVAFVPKEDLKSYRLSDAEAASVIEQLEESAEVSGFSVVPQIPNSGVILGVSYKVGAAGKAGVAAPSSLFAHGMTAIRA